QISPETSAFAARQMYRTLLLTPPFWVFRKNRGLTGSAARAPCRARAHPSQPHPDRRGWCLEGRRAGCRATGGDIEWGEAPLCRARPASLCWPSGISPNDLRRCYGLLRGELAALRGSGSWSVDQIFVYGPNARS